jgi:hypothetical protein
MSLDVIHKGIFTNFNKSSWLHSSKKYQVCSRIKKCYSETFGGLNNTSVLSDYHISYINIRIIVEGLNDD